MGGKRCELQHRVGVEKLTLIVFVILLSIPSVCIFRVISPIDKKRMDGVPSIRVHHALDYANSNHIIRWTEVFILKVSESNKCLNASLNVFNLPDHLAFSSYFSERLISRMMNRRMGKIPSICQNCRSK